MDPITGSAVDELTRLIEQGRLPSAGLMDQALRHAPPGDDGCLDAAAVHPLCDGLEASARLIAEHPLTRQGVDRVDAFRYLLSLTAFAVDWGLLSGDPLAPIFSPPYSIHRLDWGAANPDGVYRKVLVRDDCAYRIWGRMGTARYFSLDFRPSSHNDTVLPDDLGLDHEGRFELHLGGRRQGRWWPMQAGTHAIVTREFFDDWDQARKAQLRIERVEGPEGPSEESGPRIAAAFDVIGRWMSEGGVRYWLDYTADMLERAQNSFLSEFRRGETKLPVVCPGSWRLGPYESLLIELADPKAEYWGLQAATSLVHSFDHSKALTSFNNAQAAPDPDGMIRFVVAHRDPGVCNWIGTGGHEIGTLFLRCFRPAALEPPATRVLDAPALAQVAGSMAQCDAAGRRQQIAQRREGVARLLCD